MTKINTCKNNNRLINNTKCKIKINQNKINKKNSKAREFLWEGMMHIINKTVIVTVEMLDKWHERQLKEDTKSRKIEV